VKAVGRGLLWPARRFVDPRVEGVLAHVDARNEELLAHVDARNEVLLARMTEDEVMLEAIAELVGSVHETQRVTLDELERIRERVELPQSADEIRPDLAAFLNFAFGHRGFSAQEGVWFNPPVEVMHYEGRVETHRVSERIAEIPYVFRALGALPGDARVLDVGAAESTVSLSLASLGYDVTALDPRPYPFSHPRLRSVQALVEDWETDDLFDAVICLSTIEHVGLAAYEQEEHEGADVAALRHIRGLTKPGGRLVLTVPFGAYHVDSFQRTYDRAHLDELLEGWEIVDLAILRRTAPTRWEVADPAARQEAASDEPELVALVTAARSG
jgi:2-polyprenyl-3-methyl-5-hydroxy-6-metoxy-1,4-benzoquinol methylase